MELLPIPAFVLWEQLLQIICWLHLRFPNPAFFLALAPIPPAPSFLINSLGYLLSLSVLSSSSEHRGKVPL